MPIDLDTLSIIDWMLDEVIELCLLPDTWTEKESNLLNRLHSAALHVYTLGIEIDELSREALFELKNPIVKVIGYTELLQMLLTDDHKEQLSPRFAKLERYAQLIADYIEYWRSQIKNDY